MTFRETHLRTFVKTILYRISTSLITILIIFIVTRHVIVSLGAGAVESVTKLIFYYGYERFWNVIRWGKIPYNYQKKKKQK